MNVTDWLNGIVRQVSDVENRMNNAERVLFYVKQPTEAPATIEDYRPPAEWPEHGVIDMKQVVMHYRADLPPALDGISCTIRENEKVGIVGRTGSGIFGTTLKYRPERTNNVNRQIEFDWRIV